MQRSLVLFLGIFLFSPASHAKIFRNAYVSFELPGNWNCSLEGTEWICNVQINEKFKDAIIILTAKEVGPSDTFSAYEAHLKAPRTIVNKTAKPAPSKVLDVKQRQINDQTWIDGLHLGSEIASYYTRYLVTIKDRLAILVTFSAHKEHYTKYSTTFLEAIKSLRVIAPKDLLNQPNVQVRSANEPIGAPLGQAIPSDMLGDSLPAEASGSISPMQRNILVGAIILALVGLYFLRRGRLSQKKKRRRH